MTAPLAACASLAARSREELAALPYLHPGRVDLIAAGALIWGTIVERVRAAAGAQTPVFPVKSGIARSAGRGYDFKIINRRVVPPNRKE